MAKKSIFDKIRKNGGIFLNFINSIKERAKEKIQTIVLVETDDLRTLKAAEIVLKENYANIILVGEEVDIKKIANENGINLQQAKIIDPRISEQTEILTREFYELRKNKGIDLEKARKIITENPLYFGCMLVKVGYADGMVAGATHTSSDLLRAALQTIKTEKTIKVASSFILIDVPDCDYGENGLFIYADAGLNQNPSSEQLAEIAYSSAQTFKSLISREPYVAMLSHSTFASAPDHPDIIKVREAVKYAQANYPGLKVDGELQLDAAIIPEVAKRKAKDSIVAGHANVLIFPDLDSGNIAYKITERLAKAQAYGPITQGLAKPINDLSRGCSAEDIAGAIAITAVQAIEKINS